MPRVSIGMPVYNGEQFLSEAIESVLAQGFGDFELIISDNASTDATQEICEHYAQRDARISYSRLPENVGAAKNYNRVFALSTGEFFKWAAHDDLLHPEFIGRCVEAYGAFGSAPSIIYPQAEFIDETGHVIGPDVDGMHADSHYPALRAFQVLQTMNRASAICGLLHRRTMERTRLIGSFAGSDYVLLLEAALLGKIIQLEGTPMFQRRLHPKTHRMANLSRTDVVRWFDPTARSRLPARQKIYVEYLKSVLGCQALGVGAKGLCGLSVVSSVAIKRGRVTAGRWRRQFYAQSAPAH